MLKLGGVLMHRFYGLVNRKQESIKDFMEFLDFMMDKYRYINSSELEPYKADFVYHFDRIPIYTREIMQKLRFALLGEIADISACTGRLSKKVDSFTNMSD
jgi:hypothetical protein